MRRKVVKVYKCPYCGAVRSRDGVPFYVERGTPAVAKMRIRLHIATAHPTKPQDAEPEIVEIEVEEEQSY